MLCPKGLVDARRFRAKAAASAGGDGRHISSERRWRRVMAGVLENTRSNMRYGGVHAVRNVKFSSPMANCAA